MGANETVEEYFLRIQSAPPPAATDEPEDFDILTLLEAMGDHFHEHHADILKWNWKLFCAKWVRLIKWSYEEAERKEEQERKRQMGALAQQHEQVWG